ncbi:phosphotransferase [Cytobacillus sp. Sa5YUA1]|uniref:Phosphotransferase n=2 Tax=Cytobacillus TaxID=2675230 RepID=A0ABR8QJL2_9BACI|nr:phosphotransferase [Cytobacillus stercorigallinarum]MBD7935700.1 phosphotransferase [Cytobacillus stercorigallinarum]
MKKAATSKDNIKGDDEHNRLLSYLQKQIPWTIWEIKQIRQNVFKVETDHEPFILKGFRSFHKFKLQETFTSSLIKEGFVRTYSFLPLAKDPPLFFEGIYFGCLFYISPSEEPFTYQKEIDRKEGLDLIEKFHHISKKLKDRYVTLLPPYHQREKWRIRTVQFKKNKSIVKYFLPKEMMAEYLAWAEWSLTGMRENEDSLETNQVVLHGDVAHHNMIRDDRNQLFLIDFDLISIGQKESDYLQYANRILPTLDWELNELEKFPQLKELTTSKQYLYALSFPTDVFREWNRCIRERNYIFPEKMRPLLSLTIEQFQKRKLFVEELKKRIDG